MCTLICCEDYTKITFKNVSEEIILLSNRAQSGFMINPPRLKIISTGAEEAGTDKSFTASACNWGYLSLFLDQRTSAVSLHGS